MVPLQPFAYHVAVLSGTPGFPGFPSFYGFPGFYGSFTYRLSLNSGSYLQPHLRFYQQTAADIYRYFLVDGEMLPTDVSADYRLGEMEATTIGFKFGREYNEQHSWSLRLEQYVQSGDGSPAEAFGQLDQQDLYPDVEAPLFSSTTHLSGEVPGLVVALQT